MSEEREWQKLARVLQNGRGLISRSADDDQAAFEAAIGEPLTIEELNALESAARQPDTMNAVRTADWLSIWQNVNPDVDLHSAALTDTGDLQDHEPPEDPA